MKLRQLPISGNWIDPSTITKVRAERSEYIPLGGVFPDHVVVSYGNASTTLRCQSFEQAQAIRDEIAGWANEEENEND